MSYKEARELLKQGIPVKLKVWRGYWKLDKNTGEVIAHCKDGTITKATFVEATLIDDWEIATNENCDIEVK